MTQQGSDSHGREEEQTFPHQSGQAVGARLQPAEDPDVLLDIPMLNVEEIDLEVEDLRVHIAVQAEVAELVRINIGVDAYLNHLKLQIKGVEAQAQLRVKLERLLGTIEQALNAVAADPSLANSRARLKDRGDRDAERPGEQAQSPAGTAKREDRSGVPGPSDGGVEATNAARRRAQELGLDLAEIEGTGAGGRVVVRDVSRAAQS